MLQTGDEAADGAVAVSPAHEMTQTVRGGLDQVRHVRNLQQKKKDLSGKNFKVFISIQY